MKKVSVFCIWRDSGEFIHRTLSQLESLEALDGYSFSYFFYENDSKDDTAHILKQWMENRRGQFLSEELSTEKFGSVVSQTRIDNLTSARNKCKSLDKDKDADYVLLIDSDIEFSKDTFSKLVDSIEELDNAVYVACNIRQNIPDFTFNSCDTSYYDSYCFRDRYGNGGLYWSNSPFKRREDRLAWALGTPVRINSGFGGFALVKNWVFQLVQWSNDLNSEHVNFCYDIGDHGFLYIHPLAVTHTTIDTSKYNLGHFANLARNQEYEK